MGKIKRGGYLFYTWAGDHDPWHVHVLRDGKEILKWNIEKRVVMRGKATRKIIKIIDALVREGQL